MSTVVSRRRGTAAQVAAVAGAVGEILPDMTNMRLTLHNGTTLGGFPQAAVSDIVGRNRIINGNFAINQRGYASGSTLGASAYAHDRWRDGGDGTLTYTFSQGVCDTLINITAGQITHLIEGSNIEGGFYTLSWAGTCVLYVILYASFRVSRGADIGSDVADHEHSGWIACSNRECSIRLAFGSSAL